jgi:epoxyqueuosine reductase
MTDAAHTDWLAWLQPRAQALGFDAMGVAGVDLRDAEPGLQRWLAQGFHGAMDYMSRHGMTRARPAELVPGTLSVLTLRMPYLPAQAKGWQQGVFDDLGQPQRGVVSWYARGRDYHKVVRTRLQQLAQQWQAAVGPLGYRVFTDSAPVLEVELASRSGLGWRGKHTLMLSREGGSMAFLGEIFVNMALPPSAPVSAHCGTCQACMDVCPTGAIVAPYRLDARRCIAYLTIEHPGAIDPQWRRAIGNRVYGCDDCQAVCPWNRYATASAVPDFAPRQALSPQDLLHWWRWTEDEFLQATQGSAVRRIGHARWLRNVATAMGNALANPHTEHAWAQQARAELLHRAHHPSPMVREHVAWALAQQPEA